MVQMQLADLMVQYRSVYSTFASWAQLQADVEADPYASLDLHDLVAELRAQGQFREPVTLGTYEEWAYDFESEDEGNDVLTDSYLAVLDGTKRVLAHVIVGVETVLVEIREPDQPPTPELELDRYALSTELVIPLPLVNREHPERTLAVDNADEQDRELDLWEPLLSLRLSDDVWLTSDSSGSQQKDGALRYSITWWGVEALRAPTPLINNALVAKLRRLGFDTSRVQAHSKIEDWSGDAPVEVEQSTLRHMLAG